MNKREKRLQSLAYEHEVEDACQWMLHWAFRSAPERFAGFWSSVRLMALERDFLKGFPPAPFGENAFTPAMVRGLTDKLAIDALETSVGSSKGLTIDARAIQFDCNISDTATICTIAASRLMRERKLQKTSAGHIPPAIQGDGFVLLSRRQRE